MKTVLIKQPAGLGDIFFCQKIANLFMEEGIRVVWPVQKQFLWILDYLGCCEYLCVDDDFDYKELYIECQRGKYLKTNYVNVLGLDGASDNGGLIMEAKYNLVGIDYKNWYEYFNFKRFKNKENELYYDRLKLTDKSEYCLISQNYASPPSTIIKEILYNGDLQKIYIDFIDDFTVFDWCKVLENAREIHMIDTCFNYIIDKLKLKAEVLKLYTRRKSFKEIDYLFKTNWEFCND